MSWLLFWWARRTPFGIQNPSRVYCFRQIAHCGGWIISWEWLKRNTIYVNNRSLTRVMNQLITTCLRLRFTLFLLKFFSLCKVWSRLPAACRKAFSVSLLSFFSLFYLPCYKINCNCWRCCFQLVSDISFLAAKSLVKISLKIKVNWN